MPTFLTKNSYGFSAKFSPYNGDLIAVAASDNFGLTGGGSLFILRVDAVHNSLVEISKLDWPESLFDVVWSENNPGLLVSASGGGGLQIWNFESGNVVGTLNGHAKEINSIDWSKAPQGEYILSGSWDGTIKIWDCNKWVCVGTIPDNDGSLIHSVVWGVTDLNCFLSAAANRKANIWDSRSPLCPVVSIVAHDGDALTCDWCKYDDNILGTGGSDGFIRIWDRRKPLHPICQVKGSSNAVRRIQFSPFLKNMIASVSYDFTTRIFDLVDTVNSEKIIEHHSEFVFGLDWSNFRAGEIVDCGWDSLVHVFKT